VLSPSILDNRGDGKMMIRKPKTIKLSELHDCDKSHDKMVCIEIDLVGVTRCGYCHEVVDYSLLQDNPDFQEFIKELKQDFRKSLKEVQK
jgi:hypothetical protein